MNAKQKPSVVSQEQTRKQLKETKKRPFSLRKKKKESVENSNKRTKRKKKRRSMRRILPIWLRLIIFILLCGGALIIGLMIGYGILGDGSPKDVLKVEAWQHIIDIVKKEK